MKNQGRPRTFDRDAVLETLVQLFWEKGFEATSMADIVEASGLNKSSLYNTFGSKELLFHEALNRYVDTRALGLVAVLSEGTEGLADVHSLLDLLWLETESSADHLGCLAVNSSTELGMRDDSVVEVVQRFRSAMRSSLVDAFGRAALLGEIKSELVSSYANVMVSMMFGLAVLVRSGADHDEVRAQLDAARVMIDGWRIAP